MNKPAFIVSVSSVLAAIIASHYNPAMIPFYAIAAFWITILSRSWSRYIERRHDKFLN